MKIVKCIEELNLTNDSFVEHLGLLKQYGFKKIEDGGFKKIVAETTPFVLVGINPFQSRKRADLFLLKYCDESLYPCFWGEAEVRVTTNVQSYIGNDTLYQRIEDGRRIIGSTNLSVKANGKEEILAYVDVKDLKGRNAEIVLQDTLNYVRSAYENGVNPPIQWGLVNELGASVGQFEFNNQSQSIIMALQDKVATNFIREYITRR